MSRRGRKVLLLGGTGKLGRALAAALPPGDEILSPVRPAFEAGDLPAVGRLLEGFAPDLVYNAVAFLGIDPCEREPEKALRLNALFPRFLAERAAAQGFSLVHFGTDAVFCDEKRGFLGESDLPCPLNLYGLSKFGGECFVRREAPDRHHIFRLSLLFGLTDRREQFVERMLRRVEGGEKVLRVADDIVLSPTFAADAARAAVELVDGGAPPGLYHLANDGKASLHQLVSRIVEGLGLDVRVERASYREFPGTGRKNTFTPLRSERIPPLRPWEEAVDDYCARLRAEGTG